MPANQKNSPRDTIKIKKITRVQGHCYCWNEMNEQAPLCMHGETSQKSGNPSFDARQNGASIKRVKQEKMKETSYSSSRREYPPLFGLEAHQSV